MSGADSMAEEARAASTLPEEVLELEGFGQIVEDAVASGKSRRLDAAAGGDQNDAGLALPLLDGVDEVETGSVTEVDVGDDEIEAVSPRTAIPSPAELADSTR